MANDDTLVVEVPEIELGFDADGLPKVVAKDAQPEAKAKGGEVEWSEEDRKQVEELRRAKQEADRRAAEAQRERDEARATAENERKGRTEAETAAERGRLANLRKDWDLLHSDRDRLDAYANSVAIEIAQVKKDLENAQLNADYATAADLNVKLGKLGATETEIDRAKRTADARIEEKKREIEYELANPPKREEPPAPKHQEQPKQQTPEDWIAGVRKEVGSVVADWLEQNKQFVTDPKLHQKMLKFADSYHTVEEKPLNDPEFIKALEAKFMPKKAQEVEVADEGSDDAIEIDMTPKKAAAVAAPVSRATAPARPSTNNSMKVRLSPDQAAMAVQLYVNKTNPETGRPYTENEARTKYASQMLLAQKDGKFAPRE